MEELKITNIDDIKAVLKGELVEMPGFGKDDKFVARLKRPSMLALVKSGKIPNNLIVKANQLFSKGVNAATSDCLNPEMLTELLSLLDVVAESVMVEPSYKQLKENNIELTDEQLMFLFSYSQKGIKALESFRE